MTTDRGAPEKKVRKNIYTTGLSDSAANRTVSTLNWCEYVLYVRLVIEHSSKAIVAIL